jgi:hypothetical protein
LAADAGRDASRAHRELTALRQLPDVEIGGAIG